MSHPWVRDFADDRPMRSPWMEWQPDIRSCAHRCRHHDAELAKWQRIAYALADHEAHQREVIEGYVREVANLTEANAALRRHNDRNTPTTTGATP